MNFLKGLLLTLAAVMMLQMVVILTVPMLAAVGLVVLTNEQMVDHIVKPAKR